MQAAREGDLQQGLGVIGRIGFWCATHFRLVVGIWMVALVVCGTLAPMAQRALSGAGWEASGSESVLVREGIQREFGGLSSSSLVVVVHSATETANDPGFKAAIAGATRVLEAHPAIGAVIPPRPGASISRDGRTALIQASAATSPKEMIHAAKELRARLAVYRQSSVGVNLTGGSAIWSDFNVANKKAMLRAELMTWPVTLVILVLAFGSLMAAGLPLMLTVMSLVVAAGTLFIVTRFTDMSIWGLNFAMMFALALGIDYSLFIVARFRANLKAAELSPAQAAAIAMDTSGKAVFFSGATVICALLAVTIVPSPAFRTADIGVSIAVLMVLASALTVLPATLARVGADINRFSLPWAGVIERGSERSERWARHLWGRPALYAIPTLAVLLALALPALNMKTGVPGASVVPKGEPSRDGADQIQAAFGPGMLAAIQVTVPAEHAETVTKVLRADANVAAVTPPMRNVRGDQLMFQAIPKRVGTGNITAKHTIVRLRAALPPAALVGGGVAEAHDLEAVLREKSMIGLGLVLSAGFILLLMALQAPAIAAICVGASLLATGASFGVATLVFQEGFMAGILGVDSQGFLDAWVPLFFFVLIFAISIDYTVFLMSATKEQWDLTHDAKRATIAGLANSGRIIVTAAVVMVAIFFTFALAKPLPLKEMGIVLGTAVTLDAVLVRLVLLPVALRVLGAAAWWCPAWLRVLLPDIRYGERGEPIPAPELDHQIPVHAPSRASEHATGSVHAMSSAGASGVGRSPDHRAGIDRKSTR